MSLHLYKPLDPNPVVTLHLSQTFISSLLAPPVLLRLTLTFHLSLSPPDIPRSAVPRSPVRNIQVFNPTTNTLNVRWEAATGPVQQYRVVYAPLTGARPSESVSRKKSYIVPTKKRIREHPGGGVSACFRSYSQLKCWFNIYSIPYVIRNELPPHP